MKSNDNPFEGGNTQLPLPPLDRRAEFDMEIYARFMRHLRDIPNSRTEIRILTTIQFVADIMDVQDSLVAKILVDLGLRAPRMAFPEAYLESVDHIIMRQIHDVGLMSPALKDLCDHWETIDQDRFAAFRRCYPKLADAVLTRV